MIILLYGEDTFRLKQKLNEIIGSYQNKHKSGLNLKRFINQCDFDDFKQTIESLSMFNEKRLIILENIISDKNFQENFLTYIKKNKLKDNSEVVVVLLQEGKIAISGLKRYLSMFGEYKKLKGQEIANWIRQEVKKRKGKINQLAITKLVAYVGNNLWQLSNEIDKLINFKNEEVIDACDVDLLITAKLDTNIFQTLNALANRDKRTAFGLIHKHLSQNENEFYLFSMLAYQMRTLLTLKDLVEKGTSYGQLATKSGLHPYVIRKSQSQLKGFTLERLKEIYRKLLEIDTSIKTGIIDSSTALDLFIAEI